MKITCTPAAVMVAALSISCFCNGFSPTTVLSAPKSALHAEPEPLRVVIVGGGWAGFSAADALLTSSVPVTVELLDASPRQGGLAGGWTTAKTNRTVEAGLHGFWREYKNTFRAIQDSIGLDLDSVLTQYTPSMLVSESGPVAVAPVLGEGRPEIESSSISQATLLRQLAPLLPSPLDIALLSDFNAASPLTIQDRISAIGLLAAWADFEQESPAAWKRYDSISAEQLFLATAQVSPTLYRELVSPLLHVLPMTPGYDCSAAAALSCFHAFALQSKGAFDVRWCKGSITNRIFDPWSQKLMDSGKCKIRGSTKVSSIDRQPDGSFKVTANGGQEALKCDAIILAIGATSMQRLIPVCPPLQQLPNVKWENMKGVTCVAVRLFLKTPMLPPELSNAMKASPVIVCGPRILPKKLPETGFCIYDLSRLQDEFADSSAALEVDFFRADQLAALDNDEVVDVTLQAIASAMNVPHLDLEVEDVSVIRATKAVSHFCVGSAAGSPPVKMSRGLYMCGDWIDRTGHASWSTEKAVVTGRQAVNALSQDFALGCQADIVATEPDTPQLATLRRAAKSIRNFVGSDAIPRVPWR